MKWQDVNIDFGTGSQELVNRVRQFGQRAAQYGKQAARRSGGQFSDQFATPEGYDISGYNFVPSGDADWDAIRRGIFKGESGGDYNALFGYSNRDNGVFSGTRLTDMTVNQALEFANPNGQYGQWVKNQIGRVATPMGAYQIVGTTLQAAKDGLGLTGNERMTPQLQDRLGHWIYQQQGTGAWEGYKGPVY